MVIIDTTVWADYFIGRRTPQTDWLDAQADLRRLGIGDLILCEVLQGIRDEEQAETVCGELLNFELVAVGGAEVAVAAARNHRLLRAR